MLATRSGPIWKVWAPAKLNLSLEILARRPDGYHEIESLMVPITVYDNLLYRSQASGPIELECDWAMAKRNQANLTGDAPSGSENLAARAVERLRVRAGVEAGAQMQLVKRIPSAAGLGGGSSDAAAALWAANAAWGIGWSADRLATVAAEVGSDVPFFLYPGPALCRGRGERVEPLRGLGQLHFVLVRPPLGLETAQVYANVRTPASPRLSTGLIAALRRGDLAGAGRQMHNRLQAAACCVAPRLKELGEAFARLGCLGHQLSGSGSSYFGICLSRRHAMRLANRLRSWGLGDVAAAQSCW